MTSSRQDAIDAAFARFPTLETERFRLRALIPADVTDLFTLESDPRVTRYLGRAPMATLEDTARRIETFRANFETRQAIQWGIFPRDDETHLIGTCVIWHIIPAHFRAEIGYMLHPAWWGKGAMLEAVSAVIDFAFTRMKLHSLAAQIDPENSASRRVLEKLGFTQEAYFREDFYNPREDRFSDTAIFSLLEQTWAARTP